MYEIMNAKAKLENNLGEKGKKNQDITFDFEGNVIQIKKFDEGKLPETINNPKIKFK